MVRLSKDSEICLESILIYSFLGGGIYIVICAKILPHGTLYVLHRVVSEHIYVHIRRFKHFQSLPYRLNAHCGVALAEWNGDSAVWVERA